MFPKSIKLSEFIQKLKENHNISLKNNYLPAHICCFVDWQPFHPNLDKSALKNVAFAATLYQAVTYM